MKVKMIKDFLNKTFAYKKEDSYNFILPKNSNDISSDEFKKTDTTQVYKSLEKNLEYLNVKLNLLINSDFKIRKFKFEKFFLSNNTTHFFEKNFKNFVISNSFSIVKKNLDIKYI